MKKKYTIDEIENLASEIYYEEKNMKRATMIWKDLIKRGSYHAKDYMALSYYLRFYKRKNIQKAIKIFKELYAKDIIGESLPYLGECYYCGIGVKKNLKKAEEIFNTIINRDLYCYYNNYFTNPKFYLGEMYLLGNGVEKDYSKAKKYLYKVNDEFNSLRSCSYIYPYRLYYYLGYIKKIEDNKNENTNNKYFNLIEGQILKNIKFYVINSRNIEVDTIEDLYNAINRYSYRKFIKSQNNKEIRVYEKHIGYLSKSEFTEMINIIKIKLEKYMKDDNFCKIFSKYFKNDKKKWFYNAILESYDYNNIKDYISSLMEKNDYETIDFVGQLYLDGIVVEKDEKKGEKYKKKAEEIRNKFFEKLEQDEEKEKEDIEKELESKFDKLLN